MAPFPHLGAPQFAETAVAELRCAQFISAGGCATSAQGVAPGYDPLAQCVPAAFANSSVASAEALSPAFEAARVAFAFLKYVWLGAPDGQPNVQDSPELAFRVPWGCNQLCVFQSRARSSPRR